MKRKAPEEYEEFEPEDGYEEEDYEYIDEDRAQGGGIVPMLAAGVLICMLVLGAVIALSMIDFSSFKGNSGSSDPDALMHKSHLVEEAELKDAPILTTEPEPTEEPTIPPEANPYDQFDFQYNRQNYLYCLRQESKVGIDVSAFQGSIDWAMVKNSGVDFAMLRLGYRGYGAAGNMVEDEYIQKNLAGTKAVGLPIGVYFFSQATTLDEVYEEIEFMLKILGDYDIQYPIVLDWEIVTAEGRTKGVDRRMLTDMLRYFCDEMTARGFDPMVYFNWTQASRMLYLSELEDYPFWLALYQDRMTYPFRVEMWQYSCTGYVPGVNGDVDLNVWVPDLTKR